MVILAPSSVLPLQPGLRGSTTGKRRRVGHPLSYLPYVAGVSKRIRRVCKDFNIRVVFKSGLTLHSLLSKVKDPLPMRSKQMLSMKCHAPAERCTLARLHIDLKHVWQDTCIKGFMDTSAIAEHAWTEDHLIRWDDTNTLRNVLAKHKWNLFKFVSTQGYRCPLQEKSCDCG